MERDNKYRGRDINGTWAYGYLFVGEKDPKEKYSIILKQTRPNVDNSITKKFSITFHESEISIVENNTVGQYTGLEDKNKVEIYEDDVVKAPLFDPIFGDIIKDAYCNARIIFNKGSFVVSYYNNNCNIYLSDLYDKIEVIGNIHDNKDLLTE